MIAILFSGSLLLTVYRCRDKIDSWIGHGVQAVFFKTPSEEEAALPWLNHLFRIVRSGGTLTEALRSFPELQKNNPYAQESQKILASDPGKNPLAQFVFASIRSGGPVLDSFQFIRRQMEQRIRGKRRARALTAQARLQAGVIFFAPWGLLVSLSMSDPEMARLAFNDPLCLGVWSVAFLMSVLGMLWIQRIVRSAIDPRTQLIWISENTLPNFLLHVYTRVAAGTPVDEAARAALPCDAPENFRKIFLDVTTETPDLKASPLFLLEVRDALKAAATRGCPLKEELQRFLDDSESRREARIEEALQRLPVKILAPLFVCVLPAALLILFSYLLPVFNQWTD